jgi:nicotinamidase-related amidase
MTGRKALNMKLKTFPSKAKKMLMKNILNRDESFLIVVDIQQRLHDAMEDAVRETFLKNSIILIEAAHACGMPIVVSEQYPKGLGKTIDMIETHIRDIPRHEKLSFSCYRDLNIKNVIASLDRRTALICGIEAHVCVMQTALDLLAEGYGVAVPSDAVCSRRPHDRIVAMKAMAHAGAMIYSTESIVFMLIEKAGTELFKRLSPLFKGDRTTAY